MATKRVERSWELLLFSGGVPFVKEVPPSALQEAFAAHVVALLEQAGLGAMLREHAQMSLMALQHGSQSTSLHEHEAFAVTPKSPSTAFSAECRRWLRAQWHAGLLASLRDQLTALPPAADVAVSLIKREFQLMRRLR